MRKFSRSELIDIYNDTINYGKKMLLADNPKKSYKYNFANFEICDKFPKLFKKTNIRVENSDVIESIMKLDKESSSNKDNRILVLNLASDKYFGGGARSGAMAQEEELFRKTDYGIHSGKELYPLSRDEFLYTPYVRVIKDSNYNKLDIESIVPFDGLAIAGIRYPTLVNDKLSNDDYDLTKQKIETIFKFAIHNKNTNLVLGALGCGAFRNPPKDIVEIFNFCLEKYNGYFENIVFSVLSVNNDNYKIFNENIIKF
jgi:uncharacterized protein (TIGR02452 family)